MSKTTSFLRPLLGMPTLSMRKNGFKEAYLGNYKKTGDVWGDKIYFTFDSDSLTNDAINYLCEKDNYLSHEMDLDENVHIFEFDISAENKEKVVKPFIEGKYSRIDRDYVQANFPKLVVNGPIMNVSKHWKVLHKDPSLARAWEKRLGVKFTDNMEVCSIPLKHEEIYGYPEIHVSPDGEVISAEGSHTTETTDSPRTV